MRSPCDTLRLNAVVGVTLILLKRWSSVHAAAAGARPPGFVTAVPRYSRDCHVLRDGHRDHRVPSSAAAATRSVVGAQHAGFSLPIHAIGLTRSSNANDGHARLPTAVSSLAWLSPLYTHIIRVYVLTFQVKTTPLLRLPYTPNSEPKCKDHWSINLKTKGYLNFRSER